MRNMEYIIQAKIFRIGYKGRRTHISNVKEFTITHNKLVITFEVTRNTHIRKVKSIVACGCNI